MIESPKCGLNVQCSVVCLPACVRNIYYVMYPMIFITCIYSGIHFCYTGSLSHNSQGYIYTASHMAIATVLCIVISLVLGAFAGYHISLRRNPRDVCAHLKNPICTNQLEKPSNSQNEHHYSPMPRAKQTNVIYDTKQNGHPRTKLDSVNSRQEYV